MMEEQKNLVSQQLQNLEERQLWTEHVTATGRAYYYNKKTGFSQWEKPRCLMSEDELVNEIDWVEYQTSDGQKFYYNIKLKKSVWNVPEDIRLQLEQYKARQKKEQLDNMNDMSNRKVQRKDQHDDLEDQQNQEEKEREFYAQLFKQMMKEKKLGQNTKWEQLQKICGDDERWTKIKQISEKKKIFNEYLQELKKIERQEQRRQADKEKDDFIKMLEEAKLTSEAKFYKTWPLLLKDQRFRVIEEKQRENYFQDFMDELYEKERDEEKKKRKFNLEYIRPKILSLPNFSQDMSWEEVNKELESDKIWQKLNDYDKIQTFQDMIYEAEKKDQEEKNKIRRYQERRNREDFRDLLIEKIHSNEINHKTKWRNFVHIIKNDERFFNLLGQTGSTPHELFEDQIEVLRTYHNDLKGEIKKYMKQINFKMDKETDFEKFCDQLKELQIFNTLEELLKRLFYNLFVNKALKQEKEAVKKVKKTQKKTFKLLKYLRKLGIINVEHQPYNEQVLSSINHEIETNSSFEKLKNLSLEQKEMFYKEFQTKISEEHNKIKIEENNNSSADPEEPVQQKKENKKSSKQSPHSKKKRKQSRDIEQELNNNQNHKKVKTSIESQSQQQNNQQLSQIQAQQQIQQQQQQQLYQQQQSQQQQILQQQQQLEQQQQQQMFDESYFQSIEQQLLQQQQLKSGARQLEENKTINKPQLTEQKQKQIQQEIQAEFENISKQQQLLQTQNLQQVNDDREEGEIKDAKSDDQSDKSSSSQEKEKKKKIKKEKKQKKDKKKKKKKHNTSDSDSD